MDRRMLTSEQTKTDLKAAFLELYRTNGLSGMTIGSVSKQAGYNRCTFYNHYNDVHAILDEIENELISALESKLQDMPMLSFSDGLESVFQNFLAVFEEYGDTMYVLVGKNGDASFRTRMLAVVKKHFRETLQDRIDNEKSEYILTFATSAAFALIEHWHETGKKYSTEEFVLLTHSFVMAGVAGQIKKR